MKDEVVFSFMGGNWKISAAKYSILLHHIERTDTVPDVASWGAKFVGEVRQLPTSSGEARLEMRGIQKNGPERLRRLFPVGRKS